MTSLTAGNGRWLAWRPASREVRDTLFMLAVIGWTLAPHWWRLPIWVGPGCLAVLAWRGWLAWRQAPMPGRWSLVAVALIAAALTWSTQRTLLGRDAGVMLLVLLMTLKTLELRARRDALVVFFLGFFLVLTQFLYSQSLWTALAMGLSVWGWLTALTLAHMPAGRPSLREAGGLAFRAAAWGTPVMVALFLLFPRLAPLWNMPGQGAGSGLSEQLRLGDVAELALDESVAMRLRFTGARPAPELLYFRGPVLSDYDGERWRVAPEPDNAGPAGFPTQVASRIDYEITVEPLRISFLPLLEHTLLRPRASPAGTPEMSGLAPAVDSAGQWRLRTPLAERVRLQASAWPVARRQIDLPLLRQRELVQLPAGFHPRTLAWAAALHARPELREADASTLAGAVLAHIRREPFTYTLQPGAYEGDTVDEFWLDRRQGFCEHFSVAFVVVMRALDVPARIVTGYQGSDALPVDDYLVVRQSHAHAWAEYWQAGKGWIRADPTAAVAPERILRSLDLRAPAGLMGAIDTVSPGLRLGLRRWFEGLDNRWNQWVLGYGRQQQFKLLDGLGWPDADASSLTRLLVLLMAGAGLVGAAWAWWDARRRSPWQTLQARVRAELARWDVQPEASAGPARMAEQLAARHGGRAAPLVAELHALERLRYARAAETPTARPVDLVAWWRGFRRLARSTRQAGAGGTG